MLTSPTVTTSVIAMSTYEVGQIVRIGRFDWTVRTIVSRTVVVARTANDGRQLSKVFTTRELDKMRA